VVLAISNSGETPEILTILPLIKRLGVPLVAMTGKPESTLATAADAHLVRGRVDKEACPLNLAPTASTTATLAMGDALAVALLHSRGFTREDFAFSHPGRPASAVDYCCTCETSCGRAIAFRSVAPELVGG
jgi:arabinose-5-phosphate isomerase